jgi:7-cyano-7-deazaguanine synthase
MKNILVVLSGGMDSTTLLYEAIALVGKTNVRAISFDYGQRHRRELDCAASSCDRLHIEHDLVDVSNLAALLDRSALTGDFAVPEGHYAEESMKATVVPNRNMILLALAAGKAINEGCDTIAYAAHAGDHAIYPDCRTEFADALSEALSLCHYEPGIVLWRPFVEKRKEDLVLLGEKLGVDWSLTWSCYKGGSKHCGKCGTCTERIEAFGIAGVEDGVIFE